MTNLAWVIYLAHIADGVRGLLTLLSLAAGAATLMHPLLYVVISYDLESFKKKYNKKRTIQFFAVSLCFGAITVVIPTAQVIHQMMGITYAEYFIRSNEVKDIATPAAKLAKEFLELQLDVLRNKTHNQEK